MAETTAAEEESTQDVEAGGTLHYLTGPRLVEHWDPQRMYIGRDLSNANRLFYRGLTTFPVTDDAEEGTTPIPDLATDAGTSTEGAKTWAFTIKDGVKWEDGYRITCEDFEYGASRDFATDVITGGPNFFLAPRRPDKGDGPAVYTGPSRAAGRLRQGGHLRWQRPSPTSSRRRGRTSRWPIASLHMMDPYQDKDKGASNYQIFSNGPYKVDTWNAQKGGTLVRNDEYDPETDDVRKANPDKIVFGEGRGRDHLREAVRRHP